MSRLVFYKHVREDGGVHTGIELNGVTTFEIFEIEGEEYDPALTWYVEIDCEGDTLPNSATGALLWLLDQTAVIRAALEQLAERLRVGLDYDSYPFHWPIANAPPGVTMKVVCDAARRRVGLDIAKLIAEVAGQWEAILRRLPEAQASLK
jgi:hypothetical protein